MWSETQLQMNADVVLCLLDDKHVSKIVKKNQLMQLWNKKKCKNCWQEGGWHNAKTCWSKHHRGHLFQMLSDFYYHDKWLINCFQQNIPNSFGNHLSQFLSKNPKHLLIQPLGISCFSLSFISVNWMCLEFGLFVWQKPNEKQKICLQKQFEDIAQTVRLKDESEK